MIRTAIIITDHPRAVADVVITVMERSGTIWPGEGLYTGHPRNVVFVTVQRAEVNRLRQAVLDVDPGAFVVIGQGHAAYGKGFRQTRRHGAPVPTLIEGAAEAPALDPGDPRA